MAEFTRQVWLNVPPQDDGRPPVLAYRYGGWLWAMIEGQETYPDFWIEYVPEGDIEPPPCCPDGRTCSKCW